MNIERVLLVNYWHYTCFVLFFVQIKSLTFWYGQQGSSHTVGVILFDWNTTYGETIAEGRTGCFHGFCLSHHP